jgi:hypothetical protein
VELVPSYSADLKIVYLGFDWASYVEGVCSGEGVTLRFKKCPNGIALIQKSPIKLSADMSNVSIVLLSGQTLVKRELFWSAQESIHVDEASW